MVKPCCRVTGIHLQLYPHAFAALQLTILPWDNQRLGLPAQFFIAFISVAAPSA